MARPTIKKAFKFGVCRTTTIPSKMSVSVQYLSIAFFHKLCIGLVVGAQEM